MTQLDTKYRTYLKAKLAWNGPLGFDTTAPFHHLLDETDALVAMSPDKVVLTDMLARFRQDTPDWTLRIVSEPVPIAWLLAWDEDEPIQQAA
jgi:hypothetical protein